MWISGGSRFFKQQKLTVKKENVNILPNTWNAQLKLDKFIFIFHHFTVVLSIKKGYIPPKICTGCTVILN